MGVGEKQPFIIDAHVHYTPPELRPFLAQMRDQEPYWHRLLLSPSSIQGWVSAENMIDDMDSAGVDQVVLVGEYYQQHEQCVTRNDTVLALINRWPNRIRAMAVVQPNAGDLAVQEVRRCLAAGMIGVGELNPYPQRFRLDSAEFRQIVDLCQAEDLPLNLHINEEIGDYYAGKSSTPLRDYYQLIRQSPDLKLILAHWGGGLLFYELMPRVRRHFRRVSYDTAASPLQYRTAEIVRTALSCIASSKILYGSDYPLLLYPSRLNEPTFTHFLQELRDAGVGSDILGSNFLKLLEKKGESASHKKESAELLPIITETMSLRTVIENWPESEEIFGRYKLPTHRALVPNWEPIGQVAAVHGLTTIQLADLIDEINALLYSAT